MISENRELELKHYIICAIKDALDDGELILKAIWKDCKNNEDRLTVAKEIQKIKELLDD